MSIPTTSRARYRVSPGGPSIVARCWAWVQYHHSIQSPVCGRGRPGFNTITRSSLPCVADMLGRRLFRCSIRNTQQSFSFMESAGATVRSKPKAFVKPATSLIDEKVNVEVIGISPKQRVTLKARLTGDKGERYESFAHYNADDQGKVCVSSQPSVGGSYTGVEPMGLLWSMVPSPGQQRGIRLQKRDVTKPYIVTVDVFDGHLHLGGEQESVGEPLTSATFEKSYMKAGVRRIPVREGRVRGTLFIPPGDGPFPGREALAIALLTTLQNEFKPCFRAIHLYLSRNLMFQSIQNLHIPPPPLTLSLAIADIPLFILNLLCTGVMEFLGTAGGLLEFKAALLASHGFTVLSLAYFGFDDLPQSLEHVDLDYFEEATRILLQHPRVSPGGIGLFSISKGTEFVLMLAAHSRDIGAVVAVSPSHALTLCSLKHKGEPSSYVHFDISKVTKAEDGDLNVKECSQNVPPSAVIPVELINCPVYLVYGSDDQMGYASSEVEKIQHRMQEHGKGSLCSVSGYPNAGHLLEPPYTPLCSSCYHKVFRVIMLNGGEPKAHAQAQEDFWNKSLEFLRKHLPAGIKSHL